MKNRAIRTRGGLSGFTLIEALVAAGLLLVIISLASRPLADSARTLNRVRDRATAIDQNLAFLELIENDVRMSAYIAGVDASSLTLYRPDLGETIAWRVSPDRATRKSGEVGVSFPIEVTGFTISSSGGAPLPRYMLLVGEFQGIGRVERGAAVRYE